MGLTKTNENYCATIVTIQNLHPLEKCDNIQHTEIFGNWVIVSKNTKIGDKGIFFPVECALDEEYLKSNNLYRDSKLNLDSTKKGYFELNGRIRAVKLRGFKSSGLFMPIESLLYLNISDIEEGKEFNIIDNHKICEKYICVKDAIKERNRNNNKSKNKKKRKFIIDGQFNFHYDTKNLGKNIHRIQPDDIIHCSFKCHGSSFISSKVLCERKLKWYEKIAKFLGIKVVESEYKNIYASRRVIKNLYEEDKQHFYDVDIWKLANEKISPFLSDGLSVYGEICGFTPTGSYIQKGYDYGCEPKEHKIYIYRITYTSPDGIIFEFTPKQVEIWCNENHLPYVPELYYGKAKELFYDLWIKHHGSKDSHEDKNRKIMNKYGCKAWNNDLFLKLLSEEFTDKDCYICKNKVPEEGCVVKIDGINDAFKLKSFRFLEYETKQLDSGEVDIEENN